MKTKLFHNYVPGDDFLLNKEELSCRICKENFAVARLESEKLVTVAARGKIKSNETLMDFRTLPIEERTFLESAFSKGKTVVTLFGETLTLLYPQGFCVTGLIGILQPYGGTPNQLRDAILRLPITVDFSPSVKRLPTKKRIPKGLCEALMETFWGCNRIFEADWKELRPLVADIAWFCGCKTNLLALPQIGLQTTETALQKLVLFLTCFFLSVSGTDPSGPVFRVTDAKKETFALGALQTLPEPKKIPSMEFLSLDCFSNVQVVKTKNQFQLQIILPAIRHETGLHAATVYERILLTLTEENEGVEKLR